MQSDGDLQSEHPEIGPQQTSAAGATREMARRATRRETPARLRLQVALIMAVAAILLLSTSLLMARVQEQVRIIGDQAAPQAATAADLYFALSDLDAQVARMVLAGDTDALAGNRLDALGTYRERSREVDAALQRSLTTGTGAADRAIVLELMNHLAVHRERVWQALTAGDSAPGFYTQATRVLHLDLLPAAQRLRVASEERLAAAYQDKGLTQTLAVTCALVLGTLLAGLLIGLQVWLARRFRRMVNPPLLLATALTVALLIPLVIVLSVQGSRMADARRESLQPFLELSTARSISYDAAADTSRFLISGGLDHYQRDFTGKAACLQRGGPCGNGGPAVPGGGLGALAGSDEVTRRWSAYLVAHDRVHQLATGGQRDRAIGILTGIRRGDAAFDFVHYDAAVAAIADQQRAAFASSMRSTEGLLRGWPLFPLVALGLVILLVPFAVRRRLAEYR